MSADDRQFAINEQDSSLPVHDLEQQDVDEQSADQIKGGIVVVKHTDTGSPIVSPGLGGETPLPSMSKALGTGSA